MGIKSGNKTKSLLCRDLGTLSYTQQESTLRLHDSRAGPVSWGLSIVMLGSRLEIF